MHCLLDGSAAVLDTPAVPLPSAFLVREAIHGWERREALALRRAVFCIEQGLFVESGGDDHDAIDDLPRHHAQLLVAMTCAAGQPDQVVGTVRIHRAPDEHAGLWWGGRLAVHAAFRRQGQIGATLIRLAVTRAHAQGCHTFLAHVQAQNQPLFEKLHWRALRTLKLHGRLHAEMQADLAFYPPCHDPVSGFVVRPRSLA